jgi:hypothetical protein
LFSEIKPQKFDLKKGKSEELMPARNFSISANAKKNDGFKR